MMWSHDHLYSPGSKILLTFVQNISNNETAMTSTRRLVYFNKNIWQDIFFSSPCLFACLRKLQIWNFSKLRWYFDNMLQKTNTLYTTFSPTCIVDYSKLLPKSRSILGILVWTTVPRLLCKILRNKWKSGRNPEKNKTEC